ncbi:MAG: hypothetical protein K6F73_00495 [Lachnospiraceae bacterium]|nr:hypothetical protein [Lachnospiraceae bacterium]
MGNILLGAYKADFSNRYGKSLFPAKDDDGSADPAANVSRMRRALKKGCPDSEPVSVVDSMKLYNDFLKKQKQKTDDAALVKKKVRYSFRSISSKIVSSRTSVSARGVISQARREVQRLKDAKRSGKYDSEEIDAAIDHAKTMERIARRKARHLEEEEMAKRCSSDRAGAVSGYEPDDREEDSSIREEIRKLRDEADAMEKKAENGEYIESETVTNEMIDDLCDSMEDILDEIEELSGLMEELMQSPVDMDAEDIEAMKVKHRNREMKEMTKADAEYLKAMFEHFEAERSGLTVDVAL